MRLGTGFTGPPSLSALSRLSRCSLAFFSTPFLEDVIFSQRDFVGARRLSWRPPTDPPCPFLCADSYCTLPLPTYSPFFLAPPSSYRTICPPFFLLRPLRSLLSRFASRHSGDLLCISLFRRPRLKIFGRRKGIIAFWWIFSSDNSFFRIELVGAPFIAPV